MFKFCGSLATKAFNIETFLNYAWDIFSKLSTNQLASQLICIAIAIHCPYHMIASYIIVLRGCSYIDVDKSYIDHV